MLACHPENEHVGLCSSCRHARQVPSDRGSVYYYCHRSVHDPHYPKYPRLPVLRCPGYESRDDVDKGKG